MLGIRGRTSAVKKTVMVSALVGNNSGLNRGRETPPKMSHESIWVGYWIGVRQWPGNGTFLKTEGRPPKNGAVSSSGHSIDGAVFMPVDRMGGAGRPSKPVFRRKQSKFSGIPLGRPEKFFLSTDMESHSNLPSATGPNAQISNAAVNKDTQRNHPPYKEMITSAIVAMKEKDGSSRQAIGKYIESEYKNLSPNHATLLTQQIRKMKNQGQLIMNKHSYMLSGFGHGQSSVQGSVVTKRRPGRPPKIPSNGSGVGGVASPAVSYFSGLPVMADPSLMIGAVPMVVPMGEVDGGAGPEAFSVGRRLGRPPKDNNGIVGVGNGEGGSVLGKRGRGYVVKEAGLVSVLVGNSNDVERGYGRPHMNVAVNSSGHSDDGAVFVPVEGMEGAGRPSKMDVRRPNKQSKVKHVVDIVKPYLKNEFAPIALPKDGGIALMCAPVSRGALSGESAGIIGAPSSDQGGPGSDPVEPLCAQYRNLRI